VLKALYFLFNPVGFYKKYRYKLHKWAILVYKKDKNTCAKCGEIGIREKGKWIGLTLATE